jgi:hypothetical protein
VEHTGAQAVLLTMNPRLCVRSFGRSYATVSAIGVALFVMAGCAREEREAATLEPSRNNETTISTNPDPATAQPAPPETTASSAAASAPECKDMKEADPATCEPAAKGDPQAK